MKDHDCIFCKIVDAEIPGEKVWENEDFIAILDLFPNTKGMTLVMPKEHYNSYVVEMPDEVYCKFFSAAKEVSKILEKALGVKRVAMVMEGMGVDHAHIKLYPLHGIEKKFVEIWAKEEKFFENYEGYLTTVLGPKADSKELKEIARKIREVAE
jgi:diadenosine tetraphosphate (Ap4A) HIT family hydrolase